jgi:hypothetical protein
MRNLPRHSYGAPLLRETRRGRAGRHPPPLSPDCQGHRPSPHVRLWRRRYCLTHRSVARKSLREGCSACDGRSIPSFGCEGGGDTAPLLVLGPNQALSGTAAPFAGREEGSGAGGRWRPPPCRRCCLSLRRSSAGSPQARPRTGDCQKRATRRPPPRRPKRGERILRLCGVPRFRHEHSPRNSRRASPKRGTTRAGREGAATSTTGCCFPIRDRPLWKSSSEVLRATARRQSDRGSYTLSSRRPRRVEPSSTARTRRRRSTHVGARDRDTP